MGLAVTIVYTLWCGSVGWCMCSVCLCGVAMMMWCEGVYMCAHIASLVCVGKHGMCMCMCVFVCTDSAVAVGVVYVYVCMWAAGHTA